MHSATGIDIARFSALLPAIHGVGAMSFRSGACSSRPDLNVSAPARCRRSCMPRC